MLLFSLTVEKYKFSKENKIVVRMLEEMFYCLTNKWKRNQKGEIETYWLFNLVSVLINNANRCLFHNQTVVSLFTIQRSQNSRSS